MDTRAIKLQNWKQPLTYDPLAEWIKVTGLLAGIGAIPLLVLVPWLTRWYWAMGLAAGLLVMSTGLYYWFRSRRLVGTQTKAADPEQVLVNEQLLGRGIRVTTRRKRQDGDATHPTGTGAGSLGDRRQATILILLGIFILVPATAGLLLSIAGMVDNHRVASYLGTPALMLWAALEGMAFCSHWQLRASGQAAILGMARSGVQVLAALVIWAYLGLPEELTWITGCSGAALALLGAILGNIIWLRERRKRQKPDLEPADEAIPAGIAQKSQTVPGGSIPEAVVSTHRTAQTAGQKVGRPGRFQVFVGRDNQYYFRFRSASGEILLASEGYTTPAGCRNGIRSVKVNAPIPERYDHRQAVNSQFYFVLKAANYRIIGRSRLNATLSGCEKDIAALMSAAPQAVVEKDLGDNLESHGQDPSFEV